VVGRTPGGKLVKGSRRVRLHAAKLR
jgi:hypothetical protein